MAERVTRNSPLLGVVAAGMVLFAAGCGASVTTPAPTATQAGPTPVATFSTVPSVVATGPASFTPAPVSPAPSATPAAAPTPLVPGIGSITLTTAAAGAGARPQLAWSPVGGAATYRVTVFAEDGRPYWSWEGPDASVFLGGGVEPLPSDAPGPLLRAGMSWVVFAADADGEPIASSAITPIAP
jgi:hypothetical protein